MQSSTFIILYYILNIYVFHAYLAPTCFNLTAIIRELTPILLNPTELRQSYNVYAYKMYRL